MQTKLTQFFKKNTLDKPSTFFEKNENIINKKICLINENNIIKKDSKNEKKTLTIYTDGASKNNGKKNSILGIGVYCENVYNISERIEGRQTNQRAELYAILKALELTKIDDYSPGRALNKGIRLCLRQVCFVGYMEFHRLNLV